MRARLQSITSTIAQNNLYNNGYPITLERQFAISWSGGEAITSCPFTGVRSPLSCPSKGFDVRMKVAPKLSSFN
jgi:hypothetical protein